MAGGFVVAIGFVGLRVAEVGPSVWPALVCSAVMAMGLSPIAVTGVERVALER
jgi:hypothetical protein